MRRSLRNILISLPEWLTLICSFQSFLPCPWQLKNFLNKFNTRYLLPPAKSIPQVTSHNLAVFSKPILFSHHRSCNLLHFNYLKTATLWASHQFYLFFGFNSLLTSFESCLWCPYTNYPKWTDLYIQAELLNDYTLLLFHEVRITADQQFWINLRTKTSFREIHSLTMNNCQLQTLSIFSIKWASVSLHKMTVVNLSQFLIVQIFHKKIKHFLISWRFFSRINSNSVLILVSRSINYVDILVLFEDQSRLPTDKEVVTIQVGPTNLGSHGNIPLHWKNNAIYKLREYILLASLFESSGYLVRTNTLHFSEISRMKTRISSNYDISFNMLWLWRKWQFVIDCAVQLPLLQDIILVNYLNK